MSEISSLQARLDEITEAKCRAEWANVKAQVEKLLTPFYPVNSGSSEERSAALADLRGTIRMSSYDGMHLYANVPKPYVTQQQALAAAAFIKKVDDLQEQLEELTDKVDEVCL